jgi:hypothetical protein
MSKKPRYLQRLVRPWVAKCCQCGRLTENGCGSSECCGSLQEVVDRPRPRILHLVLIGVNGVKNLWRATLYDTMAEARRAQRRLGGISLRPHRRWPNAEVRDAVAPNSNKETDL